MAKVEIKMGEIGGGGLSINDFELSSTGLSNGTPYTKTIDNSHTYLFYFPLSYGAEGKWRIDNGVLTEIYKNVSGANTLNATLSGGVFTVTTYYNSSIFCCDIS